MLKNIASVIVGYALWTTIFLGGGTGVRVARPDVYDENGLTSDTASLVMVLLISVVASLAAGWVAGKIASPAKAGICVAILAGCLLATGVPVQLTAGSTLPVWYNALFLTLLVPATIVGGKLARSNAGATQPATA